MAAVFGVIVYRTIFTELAYVWSSPGFFQANSKVIISTTASFLNFIVIAIMDVVSMIAFYNKLYFFSNADRHTSANLSC